MTVLKETRIHMDEVTDQIKVVLFDQSFICFKYKNTPYISVRDLIKYMCGPVKPQQIGLIIAGMELVEDVLYLQRSVSLEMPIIPIDSSDKQIEFIIASKETKSQDTEEKGESLRAVLYKTVVSAYEGDSSVQVNTVSKNTNPSKNKKEKKTIPLSDLGRISSVSSDKAKVSNTSRASSIVSEKPSVNVNAPSNDVVSQSMPVAERCKEKAEFESRLMDSSDEPKAIVTFKNGRGCKSVILLVDTATKEVLGAELESFVAASVCLPETHKAFIAIKKSIDAPKFEDSGKTWIEIGSVACAIDNNIAMRNGVGGARAATRGRIKFMQKAIHRDCYKDQLSTGTGNTQGKSNNIDTAEKDTIVSGNNVTTDCTEGKTKTNIEHADPIHNFRTQVQKTKSIVDETVNLLNSISFKNIDHNDPRQVSQLGYCLDRASVKLKEQATIILTEVVDSLTHHN